MRIISQMAQMMVSTRDSIMDEARERHPESHAVEIEPIIGELAGMDDEILMSMEPDSFAGALSYGGISDDAAGFCANALALEALLLRECGDDALASLREEQSEAVAERFDVALSDDPASLAWMSRGGYEDGYGEDGDAESEAGNDYAGGDGRGDSVRRGVVYLVSQLDGADAGARR